MKARLFLMAVGLVLAGNGALAGDPVQCQWSIIKRAVEQYYIKIQTKGGSYKVTGNYTLNRQSIDSLKSMLREAALLSRDSFNCLTVVQLYGVAADAIKQGLESTANNNQNNGSKNTLTPDQIFAGIHSDACPSKNYVDSPRGGWRCKPRQPGDNGGAALIYDFYLMLPRAK